MGHCADTEILRTSRQVHRKAYDYMVKTNRFVLVRVFEEKGDCIVCLEIRADKLMRRLISVLVRTTTPLPPTTILACAGDAITVMSTKKKYNTEFNGYLLALTLSYPITFPNDSCPKEVVSIMLRAQDLAVFCTQLIQIDPVCPGSVPTLTVDLKLTPALDEPASAHKDSLSDFVTEEVQQSLLAPFRACIRAVKNVVIHGHVSAGLATATIDDMGQNEWTDPVKLLHSLTSLYENGINLDEAGNYNGAMKNLGRCLQGTSRVRSSSSWSDLVLTGGRSFVHALAQLRYTACIRQAHVLNILINSFDANSPWRSRFAEVAEGNLIRASECTQQGFWQEGQPWQASGWQRAQLSSHMATYIRLCGLVQQAHTAFRLIDFARSHLPNDALVQGEWIRISEWMASISS